MALVEPNDYNSKSLLNNFPDSYRAYIAVDDEDNVQAAVVAVWLSRHRVLHIEDFALHPRIRGRGWARGLWQGWLDHIREDWPVTNLAEGRLMIEVYLHNCVVWNKIMGVVNIPTDLPPLLISPLTPIQLMGKGVTEAAYREFQDLQRQWINQVPLSCRQTMFESSLRGVPESLWLAKF